MFVAPRCVRGLALRLERLGLPAGVCPGSFRSGHKLRRGHFTTTHVFARASTGATGLVEMSRRQPSEGSKRPRDNGPSSGLDAKQQFIQEIQQSLHHLPKPSGKPGKHRQRVESNDDDAAAPLQLDLLEDRFADLDVSAASIRGITEVLKFERLTPVQGATLPPCMMGKDVLARAKTGTGKTIAFMLPTVERLARDPVRHGVAALVLSPTRELALQIRDETASLLTYHKNVTLDLVIGGTNMGKEQSRLSRATPSILVATPGRLCDHLKSTPGFAQQLASVRVFVLDEADRMLDMGFRKELDTIRAALPPARQTLLFSATVAPEVRQMADASLRRGYAYVDTVGEESHTHEHVPQLFMVCPLRDLLLCMVAALQAARQVPQYKIIVFLPTARMTQYCAELFGAFDPSAHVLEMHSRMSQPKRIKASAAFRSGADVIMFSSDVSARGMDYPDVSFVLQVGAPDDREAYIHRVGRTGRAGKGGMGMLLIPDYERYILHTLLQGATPVPLEEVSAATLTEAVRGALSPLLAQATVAVDTPLVCQTYAAFLGQHNSRMRLLRWGTTELVATSFEFARVMGWGDDKPPPIPAKTVGKMGLKGVPGLNVERGPSGRPGGGGGGGGGRGGAPSSGVGNFGGGNFGASPRAGGTQWEGLGVAMLGTWLRVRRATVVDNRSSRRLPAGVDTRARARARTGRVTPLARASASVEGGGEGGREGPPTSVGVVPGVTRARAHRAHPITLLPLAAGASPGRAGTAVRSPVATSPSSLPRAPAAA
eukprot:jgi/Mesvir1/13196/Mv06156-RA.1